MSPARPAYARRLADIEPFRVMQLLDRAHEIEASGHDVVHMEVGEPDFPTPAPILEAAHAALDAGVTRYTSATGTPALRGSIADYYRSRFAVDVDPERICVTPGGSGALLLAAALIVEPGDNLLMTDPGYPCNRHFMRAFEGEGKLVPVTSDTRYQLSPELVEANWDSRTRGVLLASPANPTGAVIGHAALRGICEAVREHDGFMIVDEIYHELSYGAPLPCALSIDPEAFIVGSFSKFFGMTGWRLGWLITPEDAAPLAAKLAQNLFICASAIAQAAALAAFSDEAQQIMRAQRDELAARRAYLVPALESIGLQVPVAPDGAFYVYARLPVGIDSEEFCTQALERQHVAITPGTDFGFHEAESHVRITFASELPRLREGIRRLAKALS